MIKLVLLVVPLVSARPSVSIRVSTGAPVATTQTVHYFYAYKPFQMNGEWFVSESHIFTQENASEIQSWISAGYDIRPLDWSVDQAKAAEPAQGKAQFWHDEVRK